MKSKIPHRFFSLGRRMALACFLLTVMAGCSQKSDVRVLKLAHDLDQTHAVHKAMVFMGERLHELSDGTMDVTIYPSGQLGAERELLELLQIGSLAMTKVSASPLEGFVPRMKIFSIPYIFRDKEHFWEILESDIGRSILEDGEAVRLHGLGYYDAGSRSFYTVNRAVHKPSDLIGLKIRVQESQTSMRMVSALGGAPTPISWGELYTALSQGVVDGAENNPPSFYLSKHFEVSKYFIIDEHTSVPDVLLISSHIWGSLNDQQKAWLQQAVDESIVYQRELWEISTNEALEAVKAAGVEVIYPDKKAFIDQVRDMHESYRGEPVYDMLQHILSTH